MNILIIENSIAFTGAFKSALIEAELLSVTHEVSFLLPSHSTLVNLVKDRGFKVHTLPLREIRRSAKAISIYPFFLLSNLLTLKRIVRHHRIEVVQINDFYNLLGALLRISGYKGTILTWVRFLPSTIPPILRSVWTGGAQKYSDKVLAVSETVLRQLPANKNTIRLYDPVFFNDSFHVNESEDKHISFLYLSNFTRGKGQEYAIESFAKAYKTNRNIRLKIAGGDMGLQKNRAFREELTARVNQLGLSDVITFEDFIADAAKEIKSADVVLNFSNGEALSMLCLEASYYERPVIATMCGGPEEIIAHRETGLLVPKKDIVAMTEAILTLAKDSIIRQLYGIRGKQYVTQKFSKEVFTKTLNKIILDHAR